MRFLIDENVHIKVIAFLSGLGHDAKRVPAGLKNGSIFESARRENRLLITHDHGFKNALLYPPEKSPGILFIAVNQKELELIKKLLLDFLKRRGDSSPEFLARLFILE